METSYGSLRKIPSLESQPSDVIEEKDKKYDLTLWKEIRGDEMSSHQFFFKFQNYNIFIVDSTGNIFHISPSLAVKELKIEVDYYRSIKTAKLWKNYMIYYPSVE